MIDQPPLLETDVHPDPFQQFSRWFEQAQHAGLFEPTAMALATAGPDARPSLRMVLLKGHDANGFVFYTNYNSRKGDDIAANAQVSLLWWWDTLQRQIRVEGQVEKLGRSESESYFHSRPRGAQLSALASPQSQVIANRDFLERKVAQLAQQTEGAEVPLPGNWGGYRVRPQSFEFWQGRRDRLHDRLSYQREAQVWRIERLAP